MENLPLPQAFAAAMAQLGPFEQTPRLAVAVSGGADSLALMLLAEAWTQERGGSLLALTVDHRLRPEAATEARQVAAWAAARGIVHRILTLDSPPNGPGGVQAAARAARYARLAQACAGEEILHLLTGHHRDDQAETLLLRLQRGSGITGLTGMAQSRSLTSLRLLRPLLDLPKAALIEHCAAAGLVPIADPSNAETDFARVRMRQVLAADPALFPAARLSETARQMSEAARGQSAAADVWVTRWLTFWPLGIARFPREALAERGLALALGRLCACIGGSVYPPRAVSLADLPERLLAGRPVTLGGLFWVPKGGAVWVGREVAALAPPVALDDPSALWDGRFRAATPAPGWTLGPLGAAEGARLRRTPGWRHPVTRFHADLARAPATLLAGIPAFRYLDGPALVPHLSEMPGHAPRLLAAPRRPLTAEGERGS